MHLEEYDDGTRLVVANELEEREAEIAFMVGAGVRCMMTARDPQDPLQKSLPCPISVAATKTVFRGLDKIAEGPELGYFGISPQYARSIIDRCTGFASALSTTNLHRFRQEAEDGIS